MIPRVCLKWTARVSRGLPLPCRIIPYIPLRGRLAFEVTLRSPSPALRETGPSGVVVTLINVKLQGLWTVWIINVEIQVVGKIADAISTRDRIEIQVVGISIVRRCGSPGGRSHA